MNTLRKLLLFLGALLAIATVDPAAHAGPVLVPSVSNTVGLPSALKQANSGIIDRLSLFSGTTVMTLSSDGTKVTDNVWMYHAFTRDCTGVRIVLTNYKCATNEVIGSNPVVYRVALEYPTGTYYQFLFNGKRDVVVEPGGTVISDPLPVWLQATVGFCHTRLNVSVAAPPSSLAAVGSASGGSLSAATYYYKVTCVTAGAGESSALTEVNYAASGSTSSVALTWTPPVPTSGPLSPVAYNIYRGTATNTETLLTSVPVGTNGYTDTGALTPGSATVPAARTWPMSSVLTTSGTDKGNTATTTYQDLTTSGSIPTNTGVHVAGAIALVAFPTGTSISSISNIGGIGTSIPMGVGDDYANNQYGYFWRGALGANGAVGLINIGTASDSYTLFDTLTNSYRRLSLLESCNWVLIEEGANDYGNAPAQLLALAVTLQKQLQAMGKKMVITTLLPITTTSDGASTVANQTSKNANAFGTYANSGNVSSATSTSITVGSAITSGTYNTNYFLTILTGTGAGQVRKITTNTTTVINVGTAWTVTPDATSTYGIKNTRVEYNDWVRNGCTVDGTGAAAPAGSATVLPNPYGVVTYLETADVVETSRNSGYWKAPSGGANSTGTATSATATTLVDSGKSWTSNQWGTYWVTITAGTGTGQPGAQITSNTATTLTVGSWTVQPDATSQYAIVKSLTSDGTHPNLNGAPLLGAVVTTAINNGTFAAYSFQASAAPLVDMLSNTIFRTRRHYKRTY